MKTKYVEKDNTVSCFLHDQFSNQVFVGVAKCHPADTFDLETGKKIAFIRAKEKELNASIKRSSRIIKNCTEQLTRIRNTRFQARCWWYEATQELMELYNNEDCLRRN